MNVQPIPAILVVVSLTACSVQEDAGESDRTWVGTITTEGNVTTVITESGSVWGGTARLMEEASIGVDVGPDEYMFGYIHGIYATDEEVFILDTQVPVLRVYDYAGRHLRDIGGPGGGPGEFNSPAWVAGTPDGRIFVQDSNRLNVYATDGTVLDTFSLGVTSCCIYPTIVTPDGVAFAAVRDIDEGARTYTEALQGFDKDGPVGPLLQPPGAGYKPIEVAVGNRTHDVRFAPHHTWAPAPWGAIVGGVSDQYRFEIRGFDGHTVVVIKQDFEPVPVQDGEREWWRQYTVASVRRNDPEWSWDGAEIPNVKPAFTSLIPTYSRQIWVTREPRAQRGEDCVEITVENVRRSVDLQCWRFRSEIDAFAADGRFLGEIEFPQADIWASAQGVFARDSTVLLMVTDDAGVHMVKRYRLVLPDPE